MRSMSFVLPLLAVACASPSMLPVGTRIGEPIQDREIETLAAVQSAPAEHYQKTLLVEANVVAVCQELGCWMQVEYGGSKTMVRWDEGCGGQYSFPKDSAGERVLIQASYFQKTTDPAHIAHMESESDVPLDIPEQGHELNASAVIMLDR